MAGPAVTGLTGKLSLRIDLRQAAPRLEEDVLYAGDPNDPNDPNSSSGIDRVDIDILDRLTREPIHTRTSVFRDPNLDVQTVTITNVLPGNWVIHIAAYDALGNPCGSPFEQDVLVEVQQVAVVDVHFSGGGPGPGPGGSGLFQAVQVYDRQEDPTVAFRGNRLLIAGVTVFFDPGPDFLNVEAEIFNVNGTTATPIMAPFLCSENLPQNRTDPAIAMDGSGNFFAAWTDASLHCNDFNASGVPFNGVPGDPQDVIFNPDGADPATDIAGDAVPNHVFMSYVDTVGGDVITSRIDDTNPGMTVDSGQDMPGGAVTTTDIAVDSAATRALTVFVAGGNCSFSLRDAGLGLGSVPIDGGVVAAAIDGAADMFDNVNADFVVVYVSGLDIKAKVYQGGSFGPELALHSSLNSLGQIDVAVDNSNNTFVVTWADVPVPMLEEDVYAQRFDLSGTALSSVTLVSGGSPFLVNRDPAIAINNTGTVAIVFQGGIGVLLNQSAIYGRLLNL